MVRGPKPCNGVRSSVYYLAPAGLLPPRPRARALYGEAEYGQADPLGAGVLDGG
jgi:hypothetical protein